MASQLSFISNGKARVVNQQDIAFSYPSIINSAETFIVLRNGKQYRAREVKAAPRTEGNPCSPCNERYCGNCAHANGAKVQ